MDSLLYKYVFEWVATAMHGEELESDAPKALRMGLCGNG